MRVKKKKWLVPDFNAANAKGEKKNQRVRGGSKTLSSITVHTFYGLLFIKLLQQVCPIKLFQINSFFLSVYLSGIKQINTDFVVVISENSTSFLCVKMWLKLFF